MIIFALQINRMLKISAVIITFNEERNIARCLASIQAVADDIVVVDSFSTDNTSEICRQMGVRFVTHAFEGYIEQKNYALTQAMYPFILSLDADEALSEELRKSILELKQSILFDGYTMNRLTNYCGYWVRHCGWYPDKKLRLWDSTRGQWGGTNPHDKFIMDKEARIGHLQGDLLHYSYYTAEEHLAQIEKFSTIGAEALFRKQVRPGFLTPYINAAARFIKAYFFKMGFLDGRTGYHVCKNSAYANYLKYRKLQALYKCQKD